jgi:hypothetical protein
MWILHIMRWKSAESCGWVSLAQETERLRTETRWSEGLRFLWYNNKCIYHEARQMVQGWSDF